ncbi:MAG: hypothetical protein R2717_04395 [Schumannella sp.]
MAEGNIFRAFGDKESIIDAAIARVLDPSRVAPRLRGIDPDEPTEDKVRRVGTCCASASRGSSSS